jgi:formylglycine-generating enzyme required for sulfatase activity
LLDDVLGIFDARKSESISVNVRLEAAEALGQTGDPRLEQENWISFKAAGFLMGSQKEDPSKPNYDPEMYDDESPVREVSLDAFQIAKYPVTVFEYRKFVESGGYADKRFWKAGGLGDNDVPEKWEEQKEFPNRPVVGVCWFEASAYCAWKGVRLPTEAEWEFAARGKDGRKYPWGNKPASALRLNFAESKIGKPSPVGLYPLGMTPEGIADMAGNVWEWTESLYDAKSEEYHAFRVLRGGSWFVGAGICRSAIRNWALPAYRLGDVGFRPARSLPSAL